MYSPTDKRDWITNEQYKKMSPEERKAAIKKEYEETKNMSLDDLYRELGKFYSKISN